MLFLKLIFRYFTLVIFSKLLINILFQRRNILVCMRSTFQPLNFFIEICNFLLDTFVKKFCMSCWINNFSVINQNNGISILGEFQMLLHDYISLWITDFDSDCT